MATKCKNILKAIEWPRKLCTLSFIVYMVAPRWEYVHKHECKYYTTNVNIYLVNDSFHILTCVSHTAQVIDIGWTMILVFCEPNFFPEFQWEHPKLGR